MARAQVQDLVVRLMADSKQYSATLTDGVEEAKQFSVEVEKSLAGGAPKIAGAIAGIATAAVGATAAIGALAAVVANEVTQTERAARAMDLTTESYQRMAFAASMYGIEAEDMADLLKDMSERLTEFAVIGTGEAADMMEQLGLEVTKFKGLKPDQMFLQTMDALSQVEDQQERNLYLLQIFGDEGIKLNDIIDDGSEAWIKYANSMNPASVFTEEMIEASKEYDKQTKILGNSLDGVLNVAIAGSIPMLTSFTEWATNAALAVQTWLDAFAKSPVTLAGAESKLEDVNEKIRQQENLLENSKKSLERWDGQTGQIADAQSATWQASVNANKAQLEELKTQASETETLIENLKSKTEGPNVPTWGGISDPDDEGGSPGVPNEGTTEINEGFFSIEYDMTAEHYESMFDLKEDFVGRSNALSTKMGIETLKAAEKQAKSEEDLAKKQKRIQKDHENMMIQGLSIFGEQSRTMFEIAKVAAISQATVSGGFAIMEAYRSGMQTGGPWAPAVAAAYVAAATVFTAGQIASIASTSYGGDSGGTSSGSVSSSIPATPGAGSSDWVDTTPQLPNAMPDEQNPGSGVTVIVQGDILDGDQFEEKVVSAFSNAVNTKNYSPIDSNSRQAYELRG